MNKEAMRKFVCRAVYGIVYNPDTFKALDWEQIVYKYENEPGAKNIRIVNESKINFIRQEYALLQDAIKFLYELMLELETKHEKWLVDHNGVFRYRDYKSIEGKAMMEGVAGRPIEDWFGYFYNSMMDYKPYMEKQLGIAMKGDIGEENVSYILEKSPYAKYVVHNVVLDVADEGGKSNEIDTFVILPCGVAVLEVKNYCRRGQTLVITDEPEWDVYAKGRKVGRQKNPSYQNSRHTRATIQTLRKLLGRDIPVFPLIVIGNNEVRLEKHSHLAVRNIDDFVPYLDSLKSKEHMSDEERIRIRNFLEQEDIGSNAFAVVSYREQINHIKAIVKEVTPIAGFNQAGKVAYYKMQDTVSYVLVGLTAVILILGGLVFHDLDSFMVFLIGVCLIIAAVAGVIHIGKKIELVLNRLTLGDK